MNIQTWKLFHPSFSHLNPQTRTVLLLPFSETPPFSSGLSGVAHQSSLSHRQAALPAALNSGSFRAVFLHDGSEVRVFRSPISEEIQPSWNWTDGSESQQGDRELCLIPTSWMSALTAKEGQGNCCFFWPRCVVKMLPFLTRAKGRQGRAQRAELQMKRRASCCPAWRAWAPRRGGFKELLSPWCSLVLVEPAYRAVSCFAWIALWSIKPVPAHCTGNLLAEITTVASAAKSRDYNS